MFNLYCPTENAQKTLQTMCEKRMKIPRGESEDGKSGWYNAQNQGFKNRNNPEDHQIK